VTQTKRYVLAKHSADQVQQMHLAAYFNF